MTALLRERDLPIWLAAKPWLDVRSNDEHTLVVYALAQALLDMHPDADPNVTLPAVLLHDVGWKMVPRGQARRRHRTQADLSRIRARA